MHALLHLLMVFWSIVLLVSWSIVHYLISAPGMEVVIVNFCAWNGGGDCELSCSELVIDVSSSTACCSFSWSIVQLLNLECLTASSLY